MKNITPCIAKKADKAAIKKFYKSQVYNASYKGFDQVYLMVDNSQGKRIIASAILSYFTSHNNQGLLHGVVTDKDYRKQGIGQTLIQFVLNHAQQNGPKKEIFCFVKPELQSYYQQLSFQLLANKELTNHLNQELHSRFNAYAKLQSLMVMKADNIPRDFNLLE